MFFLEECRKKYQHSIQIFSCPVFQGREDHGAPKVARGGLHHERYRTIEQKTQFARR